MKRFSIALSLLFIMSLYSMDKDNIKDILKDVHERSQYYNNLKLENEQIRLKINEFAQEKDICKKTLISSFLIASGITSYLLAKKIYEWYENKKYNQYYYD